MTSNDLLMAIKDEYRQLHGQLFPATTPLARIELRLIAETEIEESTPNLVSAYRPSDDSITIAIPESSLSDAYAVRGSPDLGYEPIWKTDLLHEIIHEFQFKCVAEPTQSGVALMKRTKRRFPGNGHDAKFYTAISECAQRLGRAADALEGEI